MYLYTSYTKKFQFELDRPGFFANIIMTINNLYTITIKLDEAQMFIWVRLFRGDHVDERK